jgi:hypothetical protein
MGGLESNMSPNRGLAVCSASNAGESITGTDSDLVIGEMKKASVANPGAGATDDDQIDAFLFGKSFVQNEKHFHCELKMKCR